MATIKLMAVYGKYTVGELQISDSWVSVETNSLSKADAKSVINLISKKNVLATDDTGITSTAKTNEILSILFARLI